MTWSDYKRQIRRVVTDYGSRGVLTGHIPLVIEDDKGRQGGKISTKPPGLQFRDGSHLVVRETVRSVGNSLVCEKYNYHYERPNGYFFRYDREETADPIRKPEFHLHVITNLPHYPAAPMTLERVLEVIEVNFFSTEYPRTVVGQEIHLIV